VANTDLVSDSHENANKKTSYSSTKELSVSATSDKRASTSSKISPDGMQGVRSLYRKQGFSRAATNIIMSSWRNSTKREYKCYISRWFQYCDRQQISRFSVSVKHVIEFLTEQYNNGLGYSALNTARGALSSLEIRLNIFSAGLHPSQNTYITCS